MPKIPFLQPTLVLTATTFVFLWVVFHATPLDIGKYLGAQVGSALGVSVSIPANPFNTLAQQLAQKEKELQQKEATLNTQANEKQKSQNKIFVYAAALGSILLALILANFYFDWRRRKV